MLTLDVAVKSGEALLDTDSGDCMICLCPSYMMSLDAQADVRPTAASCEPLSEEQKREWEAGGFDHSRKQLVFDFDMAMWREAIEICA